MNSRGFTLVELIVVIGIAAVLTTLATLGWNRMTTKAAIEGQIKTVHADLLRIRLEALYGKRERRVDIDGINFKMYSSNVQTTNPQQIKNFKYPFNASRTVIFNTSGLASGYEGSVCVDPYSNLAVENSAYVDSLVVTDGRISLGKRTGSGCVSDDITKR